MNLALAGTSARNSAARSRLNGPDAVRFVAFCAVVVLHALGDVSGKPGPSFLGDAMLFAVPFFFLLSGYFLSRTLSWLAITFRTLRRLVPVFLLWLVVYVCAAGDAASLVRPMELVRYFITGGPAYHLWFLPALGLGILIVAAARRSTPVLIVLAVELFLFGLAFGPYQHVLHLPDLPINTRNGPFFSVPFVALGYIAAQSRTPSLAVGMALVAVGLAVQSTKSFLLSSGWQTAGAGDYFLGTVPYAAGVLVVSLHLRNGALINWTADLGRATLWMYCVHALILMVLPDTMVGLPLVMSTIGGSVLTAAVAAAVASRVPLLIPLVR